MGLIKVTKIKNSNTVINSNTKSTARCILSYVALLTLSVRFRVELNVGGTSFSNSKAQHLESLSGHLISELP